MTDPCYEEVNSAFERSLAWMHKVSVRPLLLSLVHSSVISFFNEEFLCLIRIAVLLSCGHDG